ncbi:MULTISPECIES: ribonuclease P protein component [Flavobacterium]|uniref:Ribonuclease P protein component n=1 Tax=Flavobacterium sedimenticola TaxID=3043286 RepID=A0ABT6XLV0_9FLAO|nr:ribonuclease P protein component [Flavobacterium sedimenticola]MDI9256064.1 ribonuclease P protein component [Flavobacterium sedimenticola]
MNQSYPAAEKLKSKKIIDLLFTEGKSVGKYPLRLVYIAHDFEDDVPLKMGVSVSKKHFKKAVDRNYYKRVLRECYRLNKSQLLAHLDQKYCFMFLYQTADRLSYQEVEEKTKQLFEKFGKTIRQENP